MGEMMENVYKERLTHGTRAREAEIHDLHGHGADAALAVNLKIGFEELGMSFLDGRHCRFESRSEWYGRDVTSCWLCRVI